MFDFSELQDLLEEQSEVTEQLEESQSDEEEDV